MKKSIFIVIFFLMLPVVFAEIDIKQDIDNYNLGDKISVSVSIIEDDNVVDGSFETSIECTNYAKKYSIDPDVTIEKDFRTTINVKPLPIKKGMIGNCKIKAVLKNGNDDTLDTQYTGEFEVENKLNIECEPVEAVPGKEMEVSCTARKLSNALIPSGMAKLDYRKKEFTEIVHAGMFSFTVFIANDTPSGIQKFAVEAEDSKGNYGDFIFDFNVKAVPSLLEIKVNKESFKTGETIEIIPVLYDHIGDLINITINLKFTDVENNEIISKDVLSSDIVKHLFNSFALPGYYIIKVYSEGLTKEKIVEVQSLSKLEMIYSNEKVLVKNVGNVVYADKTTIVLENEYGKYLIERELYLKPGEAIEIDLSKEVPYGKYNILLSGESGSETGNVIENVEIHDNRPFYKRIGSSIGAGFGVITGAAIGSVGFIAARPLAASIILVVIIMVIVLFYSRDFIKSSIRKVDIKVNKKEGVHIERKKEGDELEGLFKDFKYGK